MVQAKTLIVSDIFGLTTALESFSNKVANSALLVDPYGGVAQNFTSESEAYQHFQNNGGLSGYSNLLATTLEKNESISQIIAFSVGASAVWLLNNNPSVFQQKRLRVFGFYPSQVRHYLSLTPWVDTTLYMARTESHFDINQVIHALQDKPALNIEKTEYLHGFMNELSVNFNRQGYQHYCRIIAKALQSQL